MRRVVYQMLVKAPVRVANSGVGIAGLAASIWPERVRSVIGGDVVTIQGVGIALLAFAVVYFALLWLLKPGEKEAVPAPHPAPAVAARTTGDSSPAMAAARDIHNYYGPPAPATQPSKSPYGSGDPPRRRERPTPPPPPPPKPDMNLTELLVRVYRIKGPPPETGDKKPFYRSIDLHIIDTAVLKDLTIWGRVGDFPLQELDSYDLRYSTLNHRTGELRRAGEWGTTTFKDLHFSRAQVDQQWPRPPETTNDEKP